VTDPLIAELRERITAADRAILAAVNRRLELVEQLKEHKESVGVAFVDPERERRLIEELRAENQGPLSDEGAEQLFQEILALVKRELAR
jgi:3-deoxy-7-phosphoheptulonate synthase/chorismate mutase